MENLNNKKIAELLLKSIRKQHPEWVIVCGNDGIAFLGCAETEEGANKMRADHAEYEAARRAFQARAADPAGQAMLKCHPSDYVEVCIHIVLQGAFIAFFKARTKPREMIKIGEVVHRARMRRMMLCSACLNDQSFRDQLMMLGPEDMEHIMFDEDLRRALAMPESERPERQRDILASLGAPEIARLRELPVPLRVRGPGTSCGRMVGKSK